MSTKEMVRRFRELHETHKQGSLSPEEAHAYFSLREDFYDALLRAKQLSVPVGAAARQMLHVPAAKKIHLTIGDRAFNTMTTEIGVQGVAAFVDAEVPIGSTCDFVLSAGGHPLHGRARVTACVRHGSGGVTHRASFSLDAMTDDDRALLEISVLDAALALLPK